jgi:hypothetical protein
MLERLQKHEPFVSPTEFHKFSRQKDVIFNDAHKVTPLARPIRVAIENEYFFGQNWVCMIVLASKKRVFWEMVRRIAQYNLYVLTTLLGCQ